MTPPIPAECQHPACSCHVADGETFCSDACKRSATSKAAAGCGCAHAACVSQQYTGRDDAAVIGKPVSVAPGRH